MTESVERWTLRGLTEYITQIEERMKDRSFAFLLGAGASKSSGIPTGGELTTTWLEELRRRAAPETDTRTVAEWATAETTGIEGFTYEHAARFYPQVFQRRFSGDAEEGYAALEAVMEGKEPYVGYAILARVMATTRHKVVVTTNFDNLVADALYSFTNTHPLVASHETLTGFIRPQLRRPLVAQVHRNLLLAPKNDTEGTSSLAPGWEPALRLLLKNHSLIVVGYGGNDGSVMGLLQSLSRSDLGGRLVWCYVDRGTPQDDRIIGLVSSLQGVLVPVIGFDEVMLEIARALSVSFISPTDLERQSKQRIEGYKTAVDGLQARLSNKRGTPDGEAATNALDAIAETTESLDDWWPWYLRAKRATTWAETQSIYEQALEHLPSNVELLLQYALAARANDLALADAVARRALDLNPKDGRVLTILGMVLQDQNRWDDAEQAFESAMAADPRSTFGISSYAAFLALKRGQLERAEAVLNEGVRRDPTDLTVMTSLTGLLLIRGKFNDARSVAVRAAELSLGNKGPTPAVAVMYRGLTSRIDGRDDTSALGRLKTIFAADYEPDPWYFDEVMASCAQRLTPDDLGLYHALGKMITGADTKAADAFERWRSAPGLPIREMWPPNA